MKQLNKHHNKLTHISIDAVNRALSETNWDFPGFYPSSDTRNIHRIHWYPAVFPPILVTMLIDILSKPGAKIFDPFCGSGVVPIESWIRGRHSVGTDSNSYALRIAQAKVDLISNSVEDQPKTILDSLSNTVPKLVKVLSSIPKERMLHDSGIHAETVKWFPPNTLVQIIATKQWLAKLPHSIKKWQYTLEIILSSILHPQLSFVRKYHHSYIVDRSRVKKPALDEVDVVSAYYKAINKAFIAGRSTRKDTERLGIADQLSSLPILKNIDCSNLDSIFNEEFDVIITSPPYFGMSDYIRSQYLSWLVFQWPEYEIELKKEAGSRRNRTNAKAFEQYILAMTSAFRSAYQALKSDGYLALTIGCSNSKLASMRKPVDILKDQILNIGFRFVWQNVRRVMFRKINCTPYRTEEIWILKK